MKTIDSWLLNLLSRLFAALAVLTFGIVVGTASTTEFSPGPTATDDAYGNDFYARHFVSYDQISGGIHAYNSALYVDIYGSGDELNCAAREITHSVDTDQVGYNGSPYPLYTSDSGRWIYQNWDDDYFWVGGGQGQFVKLLHTNAGVDYTPPSCNGWQNGGWSSTVDDNYQWGHTHIP